MKFKKAEPAQAYLKLSIYGPPGSGKTFTTLLMAEGLVQKTGKKIAYVDTERGTDFYAKSVPSRRVHPKAFEFDTIYTQSLLDVLDAVKSLNSEEYGVIVIDSISHMWDAAIAAYDGKKTTNENAGGIPMHAWGGIKRPYKELIKWLIESSFHVFILGRQKNLFETDDKDNMRKVGVAMRAEGETPYETQMCARMESRQNQKDSTMSTVLMMFEKDRSSIFSGRTFPNPSFKTIEPILALLDAKQAQSEDPDEIAAKDAELLDRDKAKQKDKEAKSADLFNGFNAQITTCPELPLLNSISEEIRKKKRYMVETHTNSLREIYNNRRDHLVNEVAPAG